jgi:hypothetical protein
MALPQSKFKTLIKALRKLIDILYTACKDRCVLATRISIK